MMRRVQEVCARSTTELFIENNTQKFVAFFAKGVSPTVALFIDP